MTDPLDARRPDKRRRIQWPEKPQDDDDDEQDEEIRKWQAIIEAAGPDHCSLACDRIKDQKD